MINDIAEKLGQFIATQILKQPKRQPTKQEALISSGLIDSFHLVDLAIYVEETFGVHLDDTELTREVFDNLEQLSRLIQQRLE